MQFTERQALIADLVRNEGFASIESLAERFAVTAQTVRRDVNVLCANGALRRVHGGVEPPVQAANLHYGTRRILHAQAKHRIAARVARAIPNGASLSISIGTTPEIVMRALAHHEGLRVFTNNLYVAMRASENPSFEVTIPGGRLRRGDCDVLGSGVQDFFAAYKVDFGIFGVAGVDADGTLLDFSEEEVAARQAILANCRAACLVLDHSKFGRNAHVRGGHISELSHVFCDAPPPARIAGMLRRAGTRVALCGEERHV